MPPFILVVTLVASSNWASVYYNDGNSSKTACWWLLLRLILRPCSLRLLASLMMKAGAPIEILLVGVKTENSPPSEVPTLLWSTSSVISHQSRSTVQDLEWINLQSSIINRPYPVIISERKYSRRKKGGEKETAMDLVKNCALPSGLY